jgi:hypothetical protein
MCRFYISHSKRQDSNLWLSAPKADTLPLRHALIDALHEELVFQGTLRAA